VRVRLIELQNGLRAMLISDRPVNDDDDDDEAVDINDNNKRQKKRATQRDTNSDDSIMQVHLACRAIAYSSASATLLGKAKCCILPVPNL